MKPMADGPTRWDLHSLYPGEIEVTLSKELKELEVALTCLSDRFQTSSADFDLINEDQLLFLSQSVRQIEKADSFYYCLSAETPGHPILTSLQSRVSSLKVRIRTLLSDLGHRLASMSDDQFEQLIHQPAIRPFISEISALRETRNSPYRVLEDFAAELAVDGLKAWEDLYIQLRNKLEVTVHDEANQKNR